MFFFVFNIEENNGLIYIGEGLFVQYEYGKDYEMNYIYWCVV